MTDQDLIATLTADLQPVRAHRTERELAVAVGLGGAVSVAAMAATFGVQPGLAGPAFGPLVMKAAYGLAIGGAGLGAALHMARPASAPRPVVAPVVAAVALLGLLAGIQLARTDRAALAPMLVGASWTWCSLCIVALALPVFGAMILMLRRQAPVRPRRAGAAAGLVAGALASAIYAFACVEHSAAFVLIWYTAGIAAISAAGWLAGPKLLRW